MMRRSLFALLWGMLLAAQAAADETRTVTDANGQTWNEVHRTITHPQTVTQCVDQPQTYYTEKCDVQTYDTYRTYYTPVTEYHMESYWVGRFNPFVQPYLAQRLVPRTRWEPRTEVVKVPVVQRSVVPVTRTVRVPVTTETTVQHDIVVARTLVSSPTAVASTPPANQQALQIGGVDNYNRRPTDRSLTTPAASDPSAAFAKAPTNQPRIARKDAD